MMGGAENVTRMIAEAALQSDEFDDVVCFVISQQNRGTLSKIEHHPRGTVVYSGARSEKTGVFKLLSMLRRDRYQLVFSSHSHINAAASLWRKLKLLRTTRLVARESTMIFERDLGWFGALVRRLYWFYGGKDFIICQTHRMLQSLNKHTHNRFVDRAETLPNPVDVDGIRAILKKSSPATESAPIGRSIAWCGRLSDVKSPLRAVDVLADLHARGHGDVHLIMMGNGPLKSEILHHAETRNLADHVTLTGRVTEPASIMKHCELGLMTSDTEGFPNVILEMLASGVRSVVTTDCAGGLADIPGVHVASQKTASSLADEMSKRLNAPTRNQDIDAYLENRSPAMFLRRLMAHD